MNGINGITAALETRKMGCGRDRVGRHIHKLAREYTSLQQKYAEESVHMKLLHLQQEKDRVVNEIFEMIKA